MHRATDGSSALRSVAPPRDVVCRTASPPREAEVLSVRGTRPGWTMMFDEGKDLAGDKPRSRFGRRLRSLR